MQGRQTFTPDEAYDPHTTTLETIQGLDTADLHMTRGCLDTLYTPLNARSDPVEGTVCLKERSGSASDIRHVRLTAGITIRRSR